MSFKAQIILIIGVVLLLAQVSMNVNGSVMNSKDFSYENEALITATAIAQSTLREVIAKRFDEKVLAKAAQSADSLTTIANLGPDGGETSTTYDDVDDYNNLVRTTTSSRLGSFIVKVSVGYTDKTLLGSAAPKQTLSKFVAVTISGNKYLPTAVKINSIVTY